MFKISPIQDKNEQKLCAEACGADFLADYFAFSMRDTESEELMGFCQFELLGGEAVISHLVATPLYSDDFEALFILGRATMNFIDQCGIHICKANINAGDHRLLHAIGFKKIEDEFFVDMTGFFDGNCSGHH